MINILSRLVKNFILIPFLLSLFIAFLGSVILTKKYESVSKLIPIGSSEKMSQASAVGGILGFNLDSGVAENLSSASYFHLILKSNSVLSKLMLINLGDNFDNKLLIEYDTGKSIDNIEQNLIDSTIAKFKGKHISVSKDRISNLITISSVYEDPRIAKMINEFIINESINIQRLSNNDYTKNRKDYLFKRINEVKVDLNVSEQDMISFLRTNKEISSKALEVKYDKINREIVIFNGLLTTLMQELEKTKIEENSDNNEIQILDQPSLPSSKSSPSLSFIFLSTFMLSFALLIILHIYRKETIKLIESFESIN